VPIGVSEDEIDAVAEIINNAKKPIILSGGGVSIAGANEEVLKLAEKCKIPVTTTLMGLGSFPETMICLQVL
jgi:acetolactate synthase-1/2/3 large subunit